MAQGDFNIQVEDFAAVAPQFAAAGSELTESTNKQDATLNGLGSFWGTNCHGPDFGAKYQPLAELVLQLATAASEAVAGVGDGLQQMGQQYDVTEQQITAAMTQLQKVVQQ